LQTLGEDVLLVDIPKRAPALDFDHEVPVVAAYNDGVHRERHVAEPDLREKFDRSHVHVEGALDEEVPMKGAPNGNGGPEFRTAADVL
jgi:hypothetical protein